MASTPNIFYFSDLHPQRITNLAADRANLHSIRTENLDVGTSIELPDGSLQIDTRGAGTPLTALPEAGALTDNVFQLRTLTAGTNVTFDITDDDITLNAPSAAVSLTSAGGAQTLVNDGVGPDLATKGLSAGTGISLASDAVSVTITNTSPASDVSLSSAGGAETLIQDGTGPVMVLKGLSGGAGINLTSNANVVTVNNASPATDVALTSAGGTSIVTDGAGPSLAVKGTTGSLSLQDTSTGIQIQFDNRCIRISDQNGDVPALAGGDTANVNGSINATALGPAAIVGAVSPFSIAAGYNCSVSPACANALSVGNSSRAQAAQAQTIGYDCQSSGINSWSMGTVARASANRSMTWALSDGAAPYDNSRFDSVAIGQSIGGTNFTLFGCAYVASTAILGFAITRGRLCHGMRRDTTSRAAPYTLAADDVLHGSVRVTTAGTITTPTGAQLQAANSANTAWWAVSTGADFYLKNKSGGPVLLASGAGVTMIDQTNAAVASVQVDDDNVGHFRVINTGTNTFEFEWLGQATMPGAA